MWHGAFCVTPGVLCCGAMPGLAVCVYIFDLTKCTVVPVCCYNVYLCRPWGRQDGHGVNCVVVKDGVTLIGSAAFASPSIGEVDMPYLAMREIGAYVFSDASISEIYLSDGK